LVLPRGISAWRVDSFVDMQGPILYIITLGVLAPYRNLGLGSKLLDTCLDTIRTCLPEVERARLHVQVRNEDAIRFYLKHGFVILETVRNYYIKVKPRDAVLLESKLN
jgi:ribosomal protein S18 acetylase RimI-like enzyme